MYPNWDFWYENKQSGNPGARPPPRQIFLCVQKNSFTAKLDESQESPVNAARHK
jgi:hypothetical protein